MANENTSSSILHGCTNNDMTLSVVGRFVGRVCTWTWSISFQQCATVTEQECETTFEEECTEELEEECTTVNDQVCEQTFETECSNQSEEECYTKYEEKCETVYKVRLWIFCRTMHCSNNYRWPLATIAREWVVFSASLRHLLKQRACYLHSSSSLIMGFEFAGEVFDGVRAEMYHGLRERVPRCLWWWTIRIWRRRRQGLPIRAQRELPTSCRAKL